MIRIPVYKPSLDGNELKYLQDCLKSTWISSKGKYLSEFEKKFANNIGVKYATATSNGTAALHLALLALGIGQGDEVIVPTLTYVASVNAIRYTGATPVFVDSLEGTWQMNPEEIQYKITPRTRAIMAVHLYGYPCNMDAISSITRKHRLLLVEDCAEAIGAQYKNCPVGNFGHIAAFSFYGNKTITTGEGGMVVTSDSSLYERVVLYKSQGVDQERQYWHNVVGYNYRMTNLCAAIGLAQLEQIDTFIEQKRHLAQWYREGLKGLPVQLQQEEKDFFHSYWMCSIIVPHQSQRDHLLNYLYERGIEARPFFCPIHLMPMYKSQDEHYPIAEALSARGINLPSWPGLSKEQVGEICSEINLFFGRRES